MRCNTFLLLCHFSGWCWLLHLFFYRKPYWLFSLSTFESLFIYVPLLRPMSKPNRRFEHKLIMTDRTLWHWFIHSAMLDDGCNFFFPLITVSHWAALAGRSHRGHSCSAMFRCLGANEQFHYCLAPVALKVYMNSLLSATSASFHL